ncbi:MAG: bifunctional riboflavin kinase/FAD synthetase [Bdellovibrionota bacterium]
MRVIQGIRNLDSPLAGSILTIGNFDGVHLGHRELLTRVVTKARAVNLPSVVMTFEPHPVKVLHPDRKFPRIFDLDDQKERLTALGLDMLVVEPFSREFSQVPAERFVSEWVYKSFSPREIVVGYDFSFGANREGSIDFLREKARDLGVAVEVVPPVKVNDVLVSSTRVRQAVEDGDVALAKALLGREFYLKGLVEKGAGRGRTIGIPTANLRGTAELVPKRGVYAAWASVRGQRYKAVVNNGLNPTFTPGLQGLSVEAHLIGFDGDLYGETLRLDFVTRLRDEVKFSSVEELVARIRSDIAEGERLLR